MDNGLILESMRSFDQKTWGQTGVVELFQRWIYNRPFMTACVCLTLLLPIFVPKLINLTFNILLTFGRSQPNKQQKSLTRPLFIKNREFSQLSLMIYMGKITSVYHCFDSKDDFVHLGYW